MAVGTATVALFGSLLTWGSTTAAQAALPGLPGKLACVRELRPSGNLEIQTLNPDGSEQRNITNNAAQDYNPIWSPDAKTIVFETERLNPGVPSCSR
jgi:hypothetical protein